MSARYGLFLSSHPLSSLPMHPRYPDTSNQRHSDYPYANPPHNVQPSASHHDVDIKPTIYSSATHMTASPSTSSQNYSTAAEDARTRNARAQARHRAKRKAYIAHLEASLASLQATLSASSPSARLQQLQDENLKLREETEMLRAQLKVVSDEGRRYSIHYSGDEARESHKASSEDSGAIFNNPPISRTAQSHLQRLQPSYSSSSPQEATSASGYTQDWNRQGAPTPVPSVPYRNTAGYLPPIQSSQQYNEQYYFGPSNTPSPNPSEEGAGSSDSYGRKVEERGHLNYTQGVPYVPGAPNASQYHNVSPQYPGSNSGPIIQPPNSLSIQGGASPVDARGTRFAEKNIQGWSSDRQ